MITFNLTLLAQMANFFVAYVFLGKFLLKPVYNAIKKEDEEKKTLQDAVLNEATELATKEMRKKEEWQAVQRIFQEQSPSTQSTISLDVNDGIKKVPSLTETDKAKLSKIIASQAGRKVIHD